MNRHATVKNLLVANDHNMFNKFPKTLNHAQVLNIKDHLLDSKKIMCSSFLNKPVGHSAL